MREPFVQEQSTRILIRHRFEIDQQKAESRFDKAYASIKVRRRSSRIIACHARLSVKSQRSMSEALIAATSETSGP